MFRIPKKDPDATTLVELDWNPWLEALEDTLQSSTWVLPDEMELVTSTINAGVTRALVKGGTPLQHHVFTNRITTASGLKEDRSVRVLIKER